MKYLKLSYKARRRNRFLRRAFVVWICLFTCPSLVWSDVGIRVIDESAISYMEFLSKVDFDQRFPGQIKSDPADLDVGWYVIYTHKKLNYYFGPILLQSTGQDYLSQLTQLVDAAVNQRPDIQGYQLVLSYEPSIENSVDKGRSGDSAGGFGNDESENKPPADESSQSSGFWGFIRKVFGF